MKLSYSFLCVLRPFCALPPTTKDLQTCLCKQHENLITAHGREIVSDADHPYWSEDRRLGNIIKLWSLSKCLHVKTASTTPLNSRAIWPQWSCETSPVEGNCLREWLYHHCQRNQNSVLARNDRNLPANHGALLSPCLQHPPPKLRVQIEMRQPWDRRIHYPHWPRW